MDESAEILAKAYINYDCDKVCVIVLSKPGVFLDPNNLSSDIGPYGSAWTAIYEYGETHKANQLLYDVAGKVIGWEGCFTPTLDSPEDAMCYGGDCNPRGGQTCGVEIHACLSNGAIISTGTGSSNSLPTFFLTLPVCLERCVTVDCGGGKTKQVNARE